MKKRIIEIFEKFESYAQQATAWKFYGVITPIFFIIVFLSFHLMTDSSYNIMILGWVLFIVSCLLWWFWTIKILQTLMSSNIELYNMIKTLLSDVNEVKSEVKDISNLNKENHRQSK